ncbi:MAG: hypothetical protein WCT04_16230 [Planctomycetota bacterium]
MQNDSPFGNIFKQIERKVKRTKVQIKGRALAQQVIDDYFKNNPGSVVVGSVKTGVVTLEVSSSAQYQEIEGFHREPLLEKLRDSGMAVQDVRAKLKSR